MYTVDYRCIRLGIDEQIFYNHKYKYVICIDKNDIFETHEITAFIYCGNSIVNEIMFDFSVLIIIVFIFQMIVPNTDQIVCY